MAYNHNNSQKSNDEVYFDLMENIGVLTNKENGWTKEVNIVAWNGGRPKVDIRDWDPDHKRMTRGITLFEEEAEKLAKALSRRYGLAGSSQSKTFIRVDHSDRADSADRGALADSNEEIPFNGSSDTKELSEGGVDAAEAEPDRASEKELSSAAAAATVAAASSKKTAVAAASA